MNDRTTATAARFGISEWEHTTPRTSPEIEQHLDELYRLTQRENNGEALTENEKHRYIWLYNEIHRLGGNIPFGVEI